MVTKRLTLVNVGNVDFDQRQRDAQKSISKRNTGVAIATRVDNDDSNALGGGGLYSVNQGSLTVCLLYTSPSPRDS